MVDGVVAPLLNPREVPVLGVRTDRRGERSRRDHVEGDTAPGECADHSMVEQRPVRFDRVEAVDCAREYCMVALLPVPVRYPYRRFLAVPPSRLPMGVIAALDKAIGVYY